MILFVTQTSTWIRKTNYTKLWFIVYHNVQNSVIEIQSEIKRRNKTKMFHHLTQIDGNMPLPMGKEMLICCYGLGTAHGKA